MGLHQRNDGLGRDGIGWVGEKMGVEWLGDEIKRGVNTGCKGLKQERATLTRTLFVADAT